MFHPQSEIEQLFQIVKTNEFIDMTKGCEYSIRKTVCSDFFFNCEKNV